MRIVSLLAIGFLVGGAAAAQKDGDLDSLRKRLQSRDRVACLAALDDLQRLARKENAAIPLIAETLSHPDDGVRLRAAMALNGVDVFEERVVLALAKALGGPDDDPSRRWCVLALVKAGKAAAPAAPTLIDALYDADLAIAESAWDALEACGHDPRPALRKRLHDADAKIRLATASIFLQFDKDKKTPVPALLELLDGKNLEARVGAAALLARTGAESARLWQALEWMIYLEDDRLRDDVFDAVTLLIPRDASALPLIVPVLTDRARSRRIEAVMLLQRLKEEARPVEGLLIDRLDDKIAEVRFQTLVTLEGLKTEPKKCVHAFANLLADDAMAPRVVHQFGTISGASAWVDGLVLLACADERGGARYQAVQLARKRRVGGKEAIEQFGRLALADRDKKVSFAALEALMDIGRPALPEIVSCLRSEDARVRDLAQYVYNRPWTDKKETAKLLAALLADKLPHARRTAAWALSQMGEDARTVLPMLRAHLKDTDAEVQRYVRQAVAAIEGM